MPTNSDISTNFVDYTTINNLDVHKDTKWEHMFENVYKTYKATTKNERHTKEQTII